MKIGFIGSGKMATALVQGAVAARAFAPEDIVVCDAVAGVADGPELAEARTACLERCLRKLPEQSHALIVSYYQGRGGAHLKERKVLARRLGITYESLKTRAHRIRKALEVCLHGCLEAGSPGYQ